MKIFIAIIISFVWISTVISAYIIGNMAEHKKNIDSIRRQATIERDRVVTTLEDFYLNLPKKETIGECNSDENIN